MKTEPPKPLQTSNFKQVNLTSTVRPCRTLKIVFEKKKKQPKSNRKTETTKPTSTDYFINHCYFFLLNENDSVFTLDF